MVVVRKVFTNLILNTVCIFFAEISGVKVMNMQVW